MISFSFKELFTNVWMWGLVILFFGGSIFVHELGHFIAARWRKLKIKRFSIGFGPKLFSWKSGETEYCLSLLPLGGYVALPQLGNTPILEEDGKESYEKLPAVSYGDRMIVCIMGVVFNFLFAFILACVLWVVGIPTYEGEQTKIVGYVFPWITTPKGTERGPAYAAGVLPGDNVMAVDGVPVDTFSDIAKHVVLGSGRNLNGTPSVMLTVERKGAVHDIIVEPKLVEINPETGDTIRMLGIAPKETLQIKAVMPNSPAAKAGLLPGDHLQKAEGVDLYSIHALNDLLEKKVGQEVPLTVIRGHSAMNVNVLSQAVPYMRPFIELKANLKDGDDEYVKIIPYYAEKAVRQDSPSTNAILKVIEISKSTDLFANFQVGDVILKIDENNVGSIQALYEALQKPEKSFFVSGLRNGKPVAFSLYNVLQINLYPAKTQSMIGISLGIEPFLTYISPWKQFLSNWKMTWRTLKSLFSYDSDLRVSQLMGPPGIMRALYHFTGNDLRLLLWFVVLLNINLGILNLLPLPILDGGRILIDTLEKLRGRAFSAYTLSNLQGAFVAVFIVLMLYVSFFDVKRWKGDETLKKQQQLQQSLLIERVFQ